MKRNLFLIMSLILMLGMFTTIWAQYSTTGPSSTFDTNVRNVTLVGETQTINYTPTEGVLGLELLTHLVADLTAGQSYTVSVTWGTFGGIYNSAGSIWIDYDQSTSFETAELIGSWSGTPTVTESYNFTVPPSALGGVTRMRVMMQEFGTLPLNPDASFGYGSKMDFGIHITPVAGFPGVATNPNPANNALAVLADTGISWTNGADTDDVQVLFGTVNPPVTEVYNGTAIESLTNALIGGPLAEWTTYYWRVVASNATGDVSGPVWNFTTELEDGYQIGYGTINNTTFGYPAPYGNYYWGARHQMLIPASELQAAGMVAPGFINGFALDVLTAQGTPLQGFTIKLRLTNVEALTAFIVDDLQTVWGPEVYTDTAGWNNHTFHTPFFWDGVSNLLVETSFANTSYTSNAIHNQTATTGYVSTITYRADSTYNYNNPAVNISSEQRPNILLTFDALDPEFDNDMAGLNVTGPDVVNMGTEYTYTVTVMNVGFTTQSVFDVQLLVDGVVVATVPYVGAPLETYDTAQVELNWTPMAEGDVAVKGKVVLTGDQNLANDETDPLNVTVVGLPVSGTFEINGDGTGDFETFAAAINHMLLTGINGPVVFNVAPGTYNEQVVIPAIMGASEVNTITFNGLDIRQDAIITYSPTVSAERYTVYLNGAKHVRLNNLTIESAAGAAYGWPILIMNQSEDIEITNNIVNTNMLLTSTSTFWAGIVASGSTTSATTGGNPVNGLLLEGNTILGGYSGISVVGATATRLTDIQIINNDVIDGYYYSIYTNNLANPAITHNFIDARSTGTTTNFNRGIYAYNSSEAFNISYNRIINQTYRGIELSGSTPVNPEAWSMIANNSLAGFNYTSTASNGIYITSSGRIKIYYNSINVVGNTGRAINTTSTAVQLDVRNNSFAYTGIGNGHAAYYLTTPVNFAANDYNNYYVADGTTFVYYDGAARADLAAYQAAGLAYGHAQNSLQGDPLYIGPFDLDIQLESQLIFAGTPIPDIDDDIQGNPRNPASPTIGAYEIDLQGFGSLDGYVYDQADNEPLAGAYVQVVGEGYSAVTNEVGYFIMPFVFNGTYDVTASLLGYIDATIVDVVVIEDVTTTINFYLEQLLIVTVSGQVVGSDFPTVGLAGASVELTGYAYYQTETDLDGMFVIPDVFMNQTYTIIIMAEGYDVYEDQVVVVDQNVDLNVIIVNEIAYPPNSLVATISPDDMEVDLIWNSPDYQPGFFWDFEDGPEGWTTGAVTGTNHWQLGTPAQVYINSAYSGDNAWMTYLNMNYENNANTWLMSPEQDFSAWTEVYFSVYLNIYSETGWDGMILESSVNGGVTWQHVIGDAGFYNSTSTSGPIPPPKWSGLIGNWVQYSTMIPALAGEGSVYLRFRFGSDGSVMYEGIAVDDVYIGQLPPDDSRYAQNPNNLRALENYNIYRLHNDDINNQLNWDFIATENDTTYTDGTWSDLPTGLYRYAVKAVYTNNVLSQPAVSNLLERIVPGTIEGTVTLIGGSGVVTDVTIEVGDISINPEADGTYSITIAPGTYEVTASLFGYQTEVATGVEVFDDMATIIDFALGNIDILVSPNFFDEDIEYDEAPAIRQLTITSSGAGDLEFSITIEETLARVRNLPINEANPLSNSGRLVMADNLFSRAPESTEISESYTYSDLSRVLGWNYIFPGNWGDPATSAVGLTAPGFWYGGAIIDFSADLGDLITKVAYWDWGLATSVTAQIYEGDYTAPTALIAESLPYVPTGSNVYVELELINPVMITGTGIYWVVLKIDDLGDTFFPYGVRGPHVANAGKLVIGDPFVDPWEDMIIYGLDYSWIIGAFVEERDLWLSVDIESGIVPAGESVVLNVTFDPLGLEFGNYSAEINISHNAPVPDVVVPVDMLWYSAGPYITYSPASYDIDLVQGNSVIEELIINNLGASNLSYSLSSLADWISFDPSAGMVMPFDSAVIEITIDSATLAPGDHTADIVITHNAQGETILIPVELYVGVPQLAVDPLSWNYGDVELLNPANKNFVLSNAGQVGTVTINDMEIAGANIGDFAFTAPGFPFNIVDLATVPITVTFTPQALGVRTADLLIFVLGEFAPVVVPLSGTGIEETIGQPINLAATVVNYNNVNLNWGMSYGGAEELIYDNNTSTGAYSYQGYTMATHMSPSGACQILSLKFYTTTQAGANEFNAEVWNWLGTEPGNTQLFTQLTPALANEWVLVDVTGANLNVTGDFVVGFGSINATTFLGYDAALNNGRTWDRDNTTGLWETWFEAYLIRAIVLYPDGRVEELAPTMHSVNIVPPTREQMTRLDGRVSIDVNGAGMMNNRALRGFNVFRNGMQINDVLVTAFNYTDSNVPNGIYEYYVVAVFYSGDSFPSNTVQVEIDMPGPLTLPFNEDWVSGSFATNLWFAQSNWSVTTGTGNPLPSAQFSWSPSVTNYSLSIVSWDIDATAIANVSAQFDVNHNYYSDATLEQLSFEVHDGTAWQTVVTYDNQAGAIPWTTFSADISTYAGNRIFKARFRAHGANSYNINYWYVDNITIQAGVMELDPPANISIEIVAGTIVIGWDAVEGANSYYIYASDDPYAADWGTPIAHVGLTEYAEPVNGMLFYKVVASTDAPPVLRNN